MNIALRTDSPADQAALEPQQIRAAVTEEIAKVSVLDVHTHLFMPSLRGLNQWGIDDLVTYHYLEAELFRFSDITPEDYWALPKRHQADAIWRALFVDNVPLSEATRGVIAVLESFGLPVASPDLSEARAFFSAQSLDAHIDKVFALAGVSRVVMTNDPLDPEEGPLWEAGAAADSRFLPVLRLDRILNRWPQHWAVLAEQGYAVDDCASGRSTGEVRRFLDAWFARMQPVYMAVSLPDTFQYPEDSLRARLLRDVVLPACREYRIPLSLMMGVRYQVNPRLKLGGDAVGRADLRALERLCAYHSENRFLASVLSRENQNELVVYARKFSNLMPFGCWWFMNNPSIVEEITRERIEMLGTSFIPQHSDARILEQLIYKWRNTRRTMAPILSNSYALLAEDGRAVTRQEIRGDVNRLFRGNLEKFAGITV